MWPLKRTKKKAAKASMHSAVMTADSAGMLTPASQVASLANSKAASAAVAELTAGLDFVLDELAGEDKTGDLVHLHLERLAEEAAKYSGSQLNAVVSENWTCSYSMTRFLQAACQCSSLVYDPSQNPSLLGLQLRPVLHRTPSTMGTVKAASIWTIDHVGMPDWTGKTLMISIRGTAQKEDHMVNMNGDPKDAICLFKLDGTGEVRAHAGFLACARALIPALKRDIADQLALDHTISNIVFTGHSAGGAVASLVFLHFVCNNLPVPSSSAGIKYSLVTFGSAPATTRSITKRLLLHPDNNIPTETVGLVMAIVNEYDLVSRADKAYLRSIINLYRSRYGLPPLQSSPDHVSSNASNGNNNPAKDDESLAPSSSTDYTPHAGTSVSPSPSTSTARTKTWPLPAPTFHLVGDIIVLNVDLVDRAEPIAAPATATKQTPMPGGDDEGVPATEAADEPMMVVKARSVSHQDFAKLLFCEIGVHRRAVYLKRMELLVKQARLSEFGSLRLGEGENDGRMDRIGDLTSEIMGKLGLA